MLKHLQWQKPIRIPKIYADTEDRPYHIPHMELSPELYQKIDWEAKLDRGAKNIDALIEDGRKRALEFLDARKRVVEGDATSCLISCGTVQWLCPFEAALGKHLMLTLW